MPISETPSALWERQPGESLQAFEAFAIYRDMGAERSLLQVARQLTKSATLMRRWSSRWSWVARVEAYNDHLDREWLQAVSERQREARMRHLRLSQMVQAKFLERISNLSAMDIPITMLDRLLRVGTETELTSLGIPSHISQMDISVEDMESVRQKILQMGETETEEGDGPEVG